MNQLIIANTGIKQDEQGRYCLNDLHRAAGGEARHKPSEWLRNKQTVELVSELEIAGIPAIESKQQVGTFVAKELVYSYAMWISPSFNLKVIRAYDAMATYPTIPQTLPEALRLAADLAEQNALLAPKAAVADRIANSDGWFCLRDSAKILKMTERKFIEWLLINKWLYRDQKGKLRGYSEKTPRYVNHKVVPIPVDGDQDRVSMQPMIMPEGLTRLASIFNVELEVAA